MSFLRIMRCLGRVFILCVACAFLHGAAFGQGDSSVYRLHPWMDASLCAVGAGGLVLGKSWEDARDPLDHETVLALDPGQVPAFDRAALRIDPTGQQAAVRISDVGVGLASVAPLLLGLDRRARQEWTSLLVLYSEAALLTGGLHVMETSAFPRYRPITYIAAATDAQRQDKDNVNAFYSGHTASTAVATFFMAKVLDDLHPELGGKRWLVYGAAALPPAIVGYYRIQAGKHFPSDVLVGGLMGAAAGILVPQLHRRTRTERLSVLPLVLPQGLVACVAWKW